MKGGKIMKEIKRTGKKVLSVFLAALMVMTAWVFVAPEKAEAANGSYWLNVNVDVTNKADAKNNIQDSYWTITYRPNNGRGNEATMKYDLKENEYGVLSNQSDNQYMHVSVPGFPTKIYYYHDATFNDKVHYTVKEIYISSSNTSGGVSVSKPNKAIKSGGWGNSEVKGNFSWDDGSKYPYVATSKSISTATAASNIGIPPLGDKKDVSTSTTTMQYYTTDQYGVRYEPTSYTFSGVTGLTTSGSIGNAYTVTANSSTTVSNTAIYQTETVKLNWKNNNSSNTSQHSDSTYTFKVYNPRYKVTYNGNAGTLGTNYTYAYLNQKVSADSSTATSNNVAGLTAEKFPTNGSREGYKFNGIWSAASGGTQYSADTKVTKNSTAYAHWTPIKYNAEFKGSRATYPAAVQEYLIANVATDFDSRPVAPTNVEEYDDGDYHYKFNGNWKNSSGNVYTASTLPIMTTAGARYKAQYNGTFVQADYSGVTAQQNEAARIKSNPNYEAIYTASSRNNLQAALDAVVTGKGRTQQDVVDGYEQHIKDAIEALEGQKYSVVFMDGRDNSIIKFSYPNVFGDTIQYPANPSMTYDKNYHYTFNKWEGTAQETNLSTVEKNITIVARFNKAEHNFTEEHVDSTCVKEGGTKYTCTTCGYSYTTYSGAYGDHVWSTEWTVDNPATCTQPGSKSHHCTLCEARKDETAIPALGHDYAGVDPEIIISSSCDSIGVSIKECNRCGYNDYITTDPIGHKMTDEVIAPTCTSKGYTISTCEVCGKMLIGSFTDPIAHNYVKKDSECVAPSCVSVGYDVSYCSVCGLKKYDIISAKGHSWNKEQTVDIEPTCTTKGQKSIHCSVCDVISVDTIEEIPANGHSYDSGEVLVPATCTQDGIKAIHCTVPGCGHTQNEIITKLGHAYSEDFIIDCNATCTTAGEKSKHCTREGCNARSEVTVIDKLGHALTVTETEATCTVSGKKVEKCSRCDYEKTTVTSEALGHNFTVETENTPSTCNTVGHVTKKCSRCEETETTYSSTLAEHSWGEWKTEQEKTDVLPKIEVRECSVCHVYDYKYTQPAGAHAWDGGVVTKAATCTEEGVRTYTCTKTDGTCSCTADTKASYEEKIPATGHTAKVEVKEATCKEAGYVKAVCQNENCPLSGRVIDEKVLPKKDHVEKVTVVEATCTTPGSRSYTCAVCGDTTKETETIPTVPHAYEATGEIVEATCTSPKYEKYSCTYCGDEKLVKIGEAAGHTVDESKTATEPATCTTAGSVSKYCSCGQLLSVDVVNPTEHTWETVTVTLPKECDGATVAYEKCSVCGSIKADSVKINESGEHEYVVTTETPATCTTAGTLRITCKHCANVNTTVSVPAVGHTYDDGVITTEQTCKQDGIVTFTCTREGCTDAQDGHTLTKNIGQKNHNYLPSDAPVAATCTSSGYQLYKCEYCDTEFKEILGAPASHVYEKQSTSTEPTCNKDGHYYFKCKNCDASYDYVVSKTGNHTYASKVTQEKTCVLPEITTYTCETKGCGESYIQISANPTGHSFGKWKVTKEPTETENGEQVRKCNNCDETETAPIPAKIHNWGATPTAKTDATCTAAATETYQCIGCNICNAETGFATYVKTVGVPLQHMVVVDYVAATCAKDGSYVAKCTLCKEEFVKETLPATGHSFNTYLQDSYVPSTCQQEGSITFACSNKDCHEIKVEKLPVNQNAHNMVEDPDNSREATCTEAAYTAFKCENAGCTHVYNVFTADPKAHTEKDTWTVKKAATCSSNGYEVLECKDCGIVMDSRTIEADPALHVWKTVEEKADHTKSGYSYEQCENCGAMRNFKTEALVEHDYSERVNYVPATPEVNGSVTYKCVCGDEKTFVIPATGCKFKEDTDKYVAPTCETDGTKHYICTIHTDCENNYTETVPALGHKAGDVELTPATCIAEGSAVVTCTRENCGAELSRVTIDKLPHTFSETDKTVVESTCQTHGTVTYTCTTEGCNATLKEELSLAEHKYKYVSSVAPTCLDSGYDVFKCENCDANYHVVTVSANGHSYELVNEIPATCSTNGHVYYECKNCSADNKAKYDYDIPATGIHTYTETVTVDAKCETAGYTYIKCADCDSIKSGSINATDPLGHDYTVEMGNGVVKCSRCDKTIVAKNVITDENGVVHSFVATITKTPTCTEEGVMTYVCQNHTDCEKNYTEQIPVTDHYVTVDSIVKIEPLCKQDGSLVDGSLVVNCAHCGKEIQKTVLPASHKFKITDVKKPNCNKEGTITEVCDDCGYIRYTYIAIDPSAHNFNYSAPVMEIKATCETDGYTVYGCTHCDAQKIVMTSPKLAHRNTTVTTVSAKCESDGYIRTTCDDCKKILSEEKIPMTGHKNTRTVTVDATCTKAGSVTVVCADCNDVLSATVLDPTGHTWGEWKRIDGATCEKEGTEKRVCLKCGDFETRQVGKGQHVYEVYKVVAPTCESEGYTVHKCRVCGHTYNDNYVEKTAHRYDGSMVVIVEPTCHSTGLKAQKCVYCGKVDPDKTHYYEIKMLSHNYGDWTVLEEAKCDSNGLKQRTCINEGCPEGFEGHTETKVISKIGHNYGEWTVTKQATCIAEGERQRTCDRCGYVDKEATAKGEHKRVPDYPVEPTCTSYGLTGGNHCEVCGEVFVAQQVIPMKNHLDINGDGKCDGCGSPTYKPDSVDTCLCHKTGIASIFYKIARFFWKILKINQTCVCGAKHY